MKSNYEPLGKHIQLVDYRNSEEVISTVLGIRNNILSENMTDLYVNAIVEKI